MIARRLGEKLAERWKQAVVVDNQPGAAANVARAKPDGHALFMVTEGALQTTSFLFSKLPCKPNEDFKPITRIAEGPFLYVVRKESPLQSMAQLVAVAKEKPSAISYGSGGTGGTTRLPPQTHIV